MDLTLMNTCREVLNENPEPSDLEEEVLNEIRFLRAGSAITLAARAKRYGDNVVRNAKAGQSDLKKIRQEKNLDRKIEYLSNAINEMFEAQINARYQVGNLVGVALTSVLISERSDKELKKLNKSSGRRR